MKQSIIYFLGLTLIASCGNVDKQTESGYSSDSNRVQPGGRENNSDFVVIKSANDPNSADLSSKELKQVNDIYFKCIADNQGRLLANTNYKRQYVPAINEKGEKIVWVNCFCGEWDETWKTEPLSVMDGGNCYFNFTLNLSTKKYYDLSINCNA